MRSAKDRRTPAAGGKTRTAREPCSRSASRTKPIKASMASKSKLPSELFRSRYSHSFARCVKRAHNIREIVKRLVCTCDVENLPFLSPHAPHFPFRDSPADTFVRVPDFPAGFRGLAHTCFIGPTIRNIERTEQGGIKTI